MEVALRETYARSTKINPSTFTAPDGRTHQATLPPELRTFASQRSTGDLVDVTFTHALAVRIAEPAAG